MTEDPSKTEEKSPVIPDAEDLTNASALDEKPSIDNSSQATGVGGQDAAHTEQAARQKKRRRKISMIVAGVLLVVLAVLLSEVFHSQSETAIFELAPQVLFEQLISKVQAGESKAIHAGSYVVDDEMIQGVRGLESLETLILDQGVLTDASMDVIATLKNLQHLRLRLSPISDEGLKKLSECESLWFLNLPHANCTASGIAVLSDLKHLRQLRLGGQHLGNEVSREITKITSLRGIHLIGVGITDEGLKSLADMPHLESLYLDDSAVTNAGWEWLFSMKPQLHVHVNEQHHDRDPKAHPHR